MENIENLFKHNIFFTHRREDCDYREGGTVRWSGIYKSNTIYDHKKLGFTDNDEILNQIKPCLSYLYIFKACFTVGLFWKDKNSNDDEYEYKYIKIWGVHISTEFYFSTFFPYNFVYRELEKPLEIHMDVHQEYKSCLSIVGSHQSEEEREEESEEPVINAGQSFKSNECLICLTNPPNVLFCNCRHIAICIECDKTKSLNICPICKTENTIKRTI